MNSYQAKNIPINEVLARLGYFPVRKDKGGVELVYNSPFREEKIPSMFVNIRKNVWNDFGDIGGNLLDFIMRYANTDFKGALSYLDNLYSKTNFKPQRAAMQRKPASSAEKDQKLILDALMPLKSPVLEKYLQSRFIDITAARKYLQVINYHNDSTGVKYFGLGLKNLSEGYEVRNPKLKTVVGKKDISFIEAKRVGEGTRPEIVSVFEGMMDFLSFLSHRKKTHLDVDVVILNSTALTSKAIDFISGHRYSKIYIFFDNDLAGEKAKTAFMSTKLEVFDSSYLYDGYKDLSEWYESINSLKG